MNTRPLLLLLVASLLSIAGLSSVLADDSPTGPSDPLARPKYLEFPDDPPLPPAKPDPNAPPARRIDFGRYTHTQVNVAPGGSNIPGDAANEPTIAVDPNRPLRMTIGWRQFDNVHSNFRQAGVAYSTDGGRAWTFPGVLDPGVFRSDPVLSYDAEGNFYYNSLHENFSIDVFKSTDGGMAWQEPVFAYGGDKQWMAIDRTSGIGRGNIYSFWTGNSNIFTRSLDGAQSFRPPTNIPREPHWGTMDVGPDGTLHIGAVEDYSTYAYSRSTDAQNPLDPTPSFTTTTLNMGGTVVYFTGPNPNGLLGQPWIGVDPSDGPTAGFIYVVGSVDPAGSDPLDLHFVRSTDGGQTWSTPRKLNNDTGTNAWQWFGTMSVAPTGRIDVVWNDTRHTAQQNWSELFYTYSTDGGTTWSGNEQISPAWDSWVGWPNQQKVGDYYQMQSDRVGANLAWAATFNGEQDVYYTRIGDYDCNGNGVGDSLDIAQGMSGDANQNGIPDECENPVVDVADQESPGRSLENSPNPFGQTTTIRFDLPQAGRVQIRIFNAGGALVRTLLDGELEAGPGNRVWDGKDDSGRQVSAGLYLYQLLAPGMEETRRALLLN